MKTTARAMSYNWLGQHDLGWLYRKRLGIIGLGKIGRAVAARANAFGMRVLYTARHRLDEEEERRLGVAYAALDDLLASADFVSLHAKLTLENERMLGAEAFARMQPTAYFINTARGGLVDEAALIDVARAPHRRGRTRRLRVRAVPADSPAAGARQRGAHPHIAGVYDPDARKAQLVEVFEHASAALADRKDAS